MLLKCCIQYISKFGKLSSGHRTGKGQFSFQSQRRSITKSVQTTGKLCSFHMLARLCWKSFKLGFSSTWTKNFQMYKLGFKEAEGPQTKLPTFVGSRRRKGSSRKTSTSASLTPLKPLTVWITTNWKSIKEMGISDHFSCLLGNLYAGQEAIVRIGHGNNGLVPNRERSMSRLYIVTLLI